MSRARWFVDIWDDDDPAVARMRDALRPTEPPGRPETPPMAPMAPVAAPDATTRRERIAELVQRIEAGDLSAVATLRQLLEDR